MPLSKKLSPLILLALVANAVTVWQYQLHLAGGNGGDDAFKFILFTMPAIWLTTIIAAIIICRKRNILSEKPTAKSGWLIFLFCTPVPLLLIYFLANPAPTSRLSAEEKRNANGKVYKTEYWEYLSGKKMVNKFFVADSTAYSTRFQNAFVNDSTWIYFKENGDTDKVEMYKNGVLIK